MFLKIKLKREKNYQSSTNCEGDISRLNLNVLEGNKFQQCFQHSIRIKSCLHFDSKVFFL